MRIFNSWMSVELFCSQARAVLLVGISEHFTELKCSQAVSSGGWGSFPCVWVGKLRHRAPPGSLCFLPTASPSFKVILLLHCFSIFLPETSHLFIYLTDKKLCVQLTKAFFGCIHPYPSLLFSSNSRWPYFDFYYLLRSGRIRPLSWSELWNT